MKKPPFRAAFLLNKIVCRNLVADVVAKVVEVFLVEAKVKQVEDEARRWLHPNLARGAACCHHFHPHLLAEKRQPSP